jgi:hypothetical protein
MAMVAAHAPRSELVALPSAGLPADHGLASLGLMMQLAGRTAGALVALAASIAWIDGRLHRHTAWYGFAIALCIARSQLHRIAGRDLCFGRRSVEGSPADPFHATRSYAIFGIGHAVVLGLIAAMVFDQPRTTAVGVGAALAVWPVVLAVVARLPRFRALRGGMPLGEDRGLEGAAIVMTVLGSYGALATVAIVWLISALSPHHLRHGWGVMLLVVFVLLLVRAGMQIRAGLAGLRDSSFDRPGELARRYAAYGVASAFCVGFVLLLLAMSERLTPEALVSVVVACWLLVTWPMIVHRYFHQRLFAELLAGDRVTHRRAPDTGLTALGWLLAAHAALVTAALIAQLTVGPRLGALDNALVLGGLAVGRGWSPDPGDAGLAIGLILLEATAAIALIRMSDQRRPLATIYAVFAGAIALAPAIPALRAITHGTWYWHWQHLNLWTVIRLLPSAIQLVLPVATLVLVHRAVAPGARARYRRNTTARAA